MPLQPVAIFHQFLEVAQHEGSDVGSFLDHYGDVPIYTERTSGHISGWIFYPPGLFINILKNEL